MRCNGSTFLLVLAVSLPFALALSLEKSSERNGEQSNGSKEKTSAIDSGQDKEAWTDERDAMHEEFGGERTHADELMGAGTQESSESNEKKTVETDEEKWEGPVEVFQEMQDDAKNQGLISKAKRHVRTRGLSQFPASSFAEIVPLELLESFSCQAEAIGYGHNHPAGILVHEITCEIRKLWHYLLIAAQNLKSHLHVEAPEDEDTARGFVKDFLSGDSISHLVHQSPSMLQDILNNPENLQIVPHVISSAVPVHGIRQTFERLKHAFQKFSDHFRGIFTQRHDSHCESQFIHQAGYLSHLREEIVDLEGKLMDVFRENVDWHRASERHGTKTVAEYVFERLNNMNVTVYQSLRILKDLLETMNGAYKGFHASGVPETLGIGSKVLPPSIKQSSIYQHLPEGHFVKKLVDSNNEDPCSIVKSIEHYFPPSMQTSATSSSSSTASASSFDLPQSPPTQPETSSTSSSSSATFVQDELPSHLQQLAPGWLADSESEGSSVSTTIAETPSVSSLPVAPSIKNVTGELLRSVVLREPHASRRFSLPRIDYRPATIVLPQIELTPPLFLKGYYNKVGPFAVSTESGYVAGSGSSLHGPTSGSSSSASSQSASSAGFGPVPPLLPLRLFPIGRTSTSISGSEASGTSSAAKSTANSSGRLASRLKDRVPILRENPLFPIETTSHSSSSSQASGPSTISSSSSSAKVSERLASRLKDRLSLLRPSPLFPIESTSQSSSTSQASGPSTVSSSSSSSKVSERLPSRLKDRIPILRPSPLFPIEATSQSSSSSQASGPSTISSSWSTSNNAGTLVPAAPLNAHVPILPPSPAFPVETSSQTSSSTYTQGSSVSPSFSTSSSSSSATFPSETTSSETPKLIHVPLYSTGVVPGSILPSYVPESGSFDHVAGDTSFDRVPGDTSFSTSSSSGGAELPVSEGVQRNGPFVPVDEFSPSDSLGYSPVHSASSSGFVQPNYSRLDDLIEPPAGVQSPYVPDSDTSSTSSSYFATATTLSPSGSPESLDAPSRFSIFSPNGPPNFSSSSSSASASASPSSPSSSSSSASASGSVKTLPSLLRPRGSYRKLVTENRVPQVSSKALSNLLEASNSADSNAESFSEASSTSSSSSKTTAVPLPLIQASLHSSTTSNYVTPSPRTKSRDKERTLNFSVDFPREQIVSALGDVGLSPGDAVDIPLKNDVSLFGRVVDAFGPIRFDVGQPQFSRFGLKKGAKVWKLLPKDIRDPDCERKLNLLRQRFGYM